MIIRNATEDDLSEIVRLGHAFFEMASVGHQIESDTISIIRTAEHLINSDSTCLFVAEQDDEIVGMSGAIMYPFHFNVNYLVGHELLWWVEPEFRGHGAGPALFEAIESWAKQHGASFMIMAAQPNLEGAKTARYFERSGYKPIDNNYMRPLERRH